MLRYAYLLRVVTTIHIHVYAVSIVYYVLPQALAARTQELERLKSDWSSHTTSLSAEHTATMNLERERVLEAQKKAQQNHNLEKKELEHVQQEKVKE